MMKFAFGALAGIGLAVVTDRIASDYHKNVITAFVLIVGLVAAVFVVVKVYTWLMMRGGNAGGNTQAESGRISGAGPDANSL